MIEQIVVGVIIAMLGASAFLALARMVKGPSVIDRAISNEVLVSTMVCALGVEAALTRHDTTLPILISLALVGFLASIAIARFVSRDRDVIDPGPDPSLLEDGRSR